MFDQDAKDYVNKHSEYDEALDMVLVKCGTEKTFKDAAKFGYNKANEWYKVSDKLPEMDVFVYLWNRIDDFPITARRRIPYEQKDWVWDCKWGSGFIVSQSEGEDYLWKEIVLPKK